MKKAVIHYKDKDIFACASSRFFDRETTDDKDKVTCKTCLTILKNENTGSTIKAAYQAKEKPLNKCCTTCKISKSLYAYGVDLSKRDGLTSRCKSCRKFAEENPRKQKVTKEIVEIYNWNEDALYC